MWRFRGTPHYLKQQAARLGITQVVADRARNNQEIYRISGLLAQLSERYALARKEGDRPILGPGEVRAISGTLEQCGIEADKLHMLAATAALMVDEAYAAFHIDPPQRPFEVLCDHDIPQILPLGDGTVGIPDNDLAPALNGSG